MKNNLRRLSKMLQLFGDTFYAASIWDNEVSCHGRYSTDATLKLQSLGFKQTDVNKSDSGCVMVRYERGIYRVTLDK